jgi:molybdopterin-containing oxidoreductase family iron-sulfur binding subunit
LHRLPLLHDGLPLQGASFVHETLTDQLPDAPRGKGTVEGAPVPHRIDKGRKPACMEACKASGRDAILFGDLNDPSANRQARCAYRTARVREDRLRHAVYYRISGEIAQ